MEFNFWKIPEKSDFMLNSEFPSAQMTVTSCVDLAVQVLLEGCEFRALVNQY